MATRQAHPGKTGRPKGGESRRADASTRRGSSTEQLEPGLPKSFLTPWILLLFLERPAHGYELLGRLGAVGPTRPGERGRYPDSGAVYRILRNLEKDGLVRSSWEEAPERGPDRRIYHLTASGREELGRNVQTLSRTAEVMGLFAGRYERGKRRRSRRLSSSTLPAASSTRSRKSEEARARRSRRG